MTAQPEMHIGACLTCGSPIEVHTANNQTPRLYCDRICKGAAKRRRQENRKRHDFQIAPRGCGA